MATKTTRVARIGNYRLGTTLGVGSFSKVKLAEHVHTRRKVAIKILNRRKLKVQQMEEKLKREIKILKSVMHPHIIKLYEVIETPTDVYVVTEYSSGGELFDYIVERGKLSENEARRFFQQIIAGIEYCHKNMIVHRDLKPENLLLDENENVKIADFGLSNCTRDGWFLKTSCGSPNYAAPEVISGKLYGGPEVDVWSCGVIVYALLCGSLPFEDESIPYLFRKIKGGLFILPSYLSDSSRDLINKMLVVDPLKRITVQEIRQHPWFTTRLPRYIANPAPLDRHLESIDHEVLDRAGTTTNQSVTKILHALKKGRRNRYTAAYHLLKDAALTLDTRIVEEKKKPEVMPTPVVHGSKEHMEGAASPMVIDKTGPGSSNVHMQGTTPAMTGPMQGNGTMKDASQHIQPHTPVPPRTWDVGLLVTRVNGSKVMMTVYRALYHLGWKWKTPANVNYQIRVLVPDTDEEKSVRMRIQLFKMPTGFQLDFQKLSGSTYQFCAYCSQLLTQVHKGLAGIA